MEFIINLLSTYFWSFIALFIVACYLSLPLVADWIKWSKLKKLEKAAEEILKKKEDSL